MREAEFSHNLGRNNKSVRPKRQQAEASADKSRLMCVSGTQRHAFRGLRSVKGWEMRQGGMLAPFHWLIAELTEVEIKLSVTTYIPL